MKRVAGSTSVRKSSIEGGRRTSEMTAAHRRKRVTGSAETTTAGCDAQAYVRETLSRSHTRGQVRTDRSGSDRFRVNLQTNKQTAQGAPANGCVVRPKLIRSFEA
eukprot:2153022-Prymnesium_polylepis.1